MAANKASVDAFIRGSLLRRFNVNIDVYLVAYLLFKSNLSLHDTIAFPDVQATDDQEVQPSISHAIDVAWLVRQDSKGGFIEPDEDMLVRDALRAVIDGHGFA